MLAKVRMRKLISEKMHENLFNKLMKLSTAILSHFGKKFWIDFM